MSEQTIPQYVVVGAGAAGSIVAGELAHAGFSVLLLETGAVVAPDNDKVWDPARWNEVLADDSFELGFVSTPQAGLNDLPLNLLQSKGTGGCQIHNAMVYVRGGQATYNHWADTLGCAGWDYQTLLPFFAKIEAKVGLSSPAVTDFANALQVTAAAFGLPYNENYNDGPSEYGCVPFQFTVTNPTAPRRATSYQAYIADQALPSLTVQTGCTVQKLIVGGSGAPTVQYVDGSGAVVTVQPSREVILSAGAIATPAILLRSGIGPANALDALSIPVLQNLPGVGQNFYDDLGVGVPVALTVTLPGQSYGYLGIGAFATANGQAPGPQPEFGEVNLELQISTTQLPGALSPPGDVKYGLIGVSSLHLKSRGTVTLAIGDPDGPPVVDPNWLSEPADLTHVLSALQLAIDFATDPGLAAAGGWTPASYFPQPTGPGEPGIPVEEMIEWIKTTGLTVQHYVGSCAMGPAGGMAVVDPSSLGVYGVPQLRIVDASIAPTPVTGNTAGVSMVIGAKGASLIIADAAAHAA